MAYVFDAHRHRAFSIVEKYESRLFPLETHCLQSGSGAMGVETHASPPVERSRLVQWRKSTET